MLICRLVTLAFLLGQVTFLFLNKGSDLAYKMSVQTEDNGEEDCQSVNNDSCFFLI